MLYCACSIALKPNMNLTLPAIYFVTALFDLSCERYYLFKCVLQFRSVNQLEQVWRHFQSLIISLEKNTSCLAPYTSSCLDDAYTTVVITTRIPEKHVFTIREDDAEAYWFITQVRKLGTMTNEHFRIKMNLTTSHILKPSQEKGTTLWLQSKEGITIELN